MLRVGDYSRLRRLYRLRDDRSKLPQTPESVSADVQLELEIEAMEHEFAAETAQMAAWLFAAYIKFGVMRVAVPPPLTVRASSVEANADTLGPPTSPLILEGAPHRSGNQIIDIWNARSEALRVARRSIEAKYM